MMYYYPERVHKDFHNELDISDSDYDNFELKYLKLCKELNQPNTLVHKHYPEFSDISENGMLEIDFSRSSVQLVERKLTQPKYINEVQTKQEVDTLF